MASHKSHYTDGTGEQLRPPLLFLQATKTPLMGCCGVSALIFRGVGCAAGATVMGPAHYPSIYPSISLFKADALSWSNPTVGLMCVWLTFLSTTCLVRWHQVTQEPADTAVDDVCAHALFITSSHSNAFKTAAGREITPWWCWGQMGGCVCEVFYACIL